MANYRGEHQEDSNGASKYDPRGHSDIKPIRPSIFISWLEVLAHPSAETFATKIADANWNITLQGLIILFIYIIAIVSLSLVQPKPFDYFAIANIKVCISVVVDIIIIPNIIHLISRISKVKAGMYGVQVYAYSLYIVPITMLSILLSTISSISGIVVVAAMLYGMVLTYFMVIAVYGFDKLHARETVVITFIFAWIILIFGIFPLV